MTSFDLFPRGARVALVGMGRTNTALFDIFKKRADLSLSLCDKREFSVDSLCEGYANARIFTGDGYLDELSEDVIFLSPTVRVDHPAISQAISRGALVTSDTSFFLGHTKSLSFAITGSDGKSTTASLARAILAESGMCARFGGNIGCAVLPFLLEEKTGDCTVLELSSFQLQLPCFTPHRALITNLTPNHLDFHLSLEEYYEAKMKLLRAAKEPVLNCDDGEIVRRLGARSPFVSYSMKENQDGRAEHAYTVREGILRVDGVPYLSLAEFETRGGTFLKNAVASLALTHGYHTPESARRAISVFRSLPHRRELIRMVDGVSYFDCSADTTPSRTLETLSTFAVPIVLLAGGRSKGTDYGILCDGVSAHARYVILYGENAEELYSALLPSGIPITVTGSLAEAISVARSVVHHGDAVVLSPASASFDGFKNYEERGEVFASLI